jgi:hypothetical protein
MPCVAFDVIVVTAVVFVTVVVVIVINVVVVVVVVIVEVTSRQVPQPTRVAVAVDWVSFEKKIFELGGRRFRQTERLQTGVLQIQSLQFAHPHKRVLGQSC